MFKKPTAPYKYAPARMSMERIDAALAAGAQPDFASSRQRSLEAVNMVTFRTPDGRIVDQFPVSGYVAATHQFVASYNRTRGDATRAVISVGPGDMLTDNRVSNWEKGVPLRGTMPERTLGAGLGFARAAAVVPGVAAGVEEASEPSFTGICIGMPKRAAPIRVSGGRWRARRPEERSP